MELGKMIWRIRSEFSGFNPPASQEALARLQASLGHLPEGVRALYLDHDGSDDFPEANGIRLAARLMTIAEVIQTRHAMAAHANRLCKLPEIAWLWTDDQSNYCGIYTDGPLSGWLFVLNHEEPEVTPAFRSIASFLSRLLAAATDAGDNGTNDLPSLPREIPETVPDPPNLEGDRELALLFRKRYKEEADEGMRRLYAFCAICLTPVDDTGEVMSFCEDPDMWIPEAAVRLLELRRWRDGVEQLERLAREGKPNGDAAALRLLVRMNTNQSQQAIDRLKQTLQGPKLKMLEMWLRRRPLLQSPRW